MKVEDIEVGQTVVDEFGNEYVVEIVDCDLMPVYLRPTKIAKRVVDRQRGMTFKRVDDCFWIFKSKEVAKIVGVEECITVESLKLKE